MRVKIDENLARAHRRILEDAGHDVADVHDEHLAGATDDVLWSHVCAEDRFLVTLDADFSDVRRFYATVASGHPLDPHDPRERLGGFDDSAPGSR